MSLATRCALVWTIFATALVALSSWLNYRSGRARLLDSWDERLGHELQLVQVRTETGVANAARDAQTLAASPAVREFVRRRGTAEAAFWREMMEEEFLAVAAGKPAYFQVRLIGLEDNGREVVRVDRTPEGVVPMATERLQQKGGRDYFQEALAAEAGAVSLSELNLNRDFGKIDVPYIPTLRASVAIRDDIGELFGMVVINVDLRGLLDALSKQTAPGVQLMLANARGDYLLHPDPSRRFGGDLGTGFTFAQDDAAHQPANALVREAEFALAQDSPRHVSARVVCPAEVWLAGLAETRNRTLLAALATAVASVPLVVWLARLPLGRLRRLTESVSRYEAGQEFADQPGGRDEIGALAGKFGELTERVRESIDKIEAARNEAHDAAQARDDFLAMMSHEIRTPLNAVSGLVRVIERNRPAPHQQPILHSLRAAMRQLVALLNDALDWSKIRARKLTFEDAVFPLREVLGDAALTHEPLARQKNLSFIASFAEQVPERARGDAARLTQVLNNLLGNALKFTEHGSIRLIAEHRDGELRLIVEDTGIGIDEAHIGRIFSPFDQAHGGIGRRFGGSGLGLSITRTLVEMQGGLLGVESRVGEGSRFTVTLPMPVAEGAEADAGAETVVASSLRGRRVLYVEDTPSNREVMAALIAETEAELVLAGTVAEGMEKLRAEPCDVVLVDLQLPDASGFDFAHEALAMRPHLPIIAVTAQTDEETRDACIAAGMMDVVVKPVEPARLFATLAKCFAGTHADSSMRAALSALFRGEPARVERVAQAMSVEFLAARAPVENGDIEARRRVRHQLHSAVHQLNLEELRLQLDRLAAGESDADLIAACVASLTKIAADLRGTAPSY
jgi:signal transduction histidine kinase/DNA-binding response OmpR family regulator